MSRTLVLQGQILCDNIALPSTAVTIKTWMSHHLLMSMISLHFMSGLLTGLLSILYPLICSINKEGLLRHTAIHGMVPCHATNSMDIWVRMEEHYQEIGTIETITEILMVKETHLTEVQGFPKAIQVL